MNIKLFKDLKIGDLFYQYSDKTSYQVLEKINKIHGKCVKVVNFPTRHIGAGYYYGPNRSVKLYEEVTA
ncbi:MAG: hypothetical protein EBT82_02410 [Micrococcales bacterium]|nr:hypothetical protein [Micrococcales bacterium]NBR54819.1 hypothetical protein [Micrococcales bacterium]